LVTGVLLKKYLGTNKYAEAFGNALIITSISGIGVNTLAPCINRTAGGVAGMAGVDFTPYGEIPGGIDGVDFTPYGGIPQGLSGVDFTPYGGIPEGIGENYEYGEEEMDGSDFGEEEMDGSDFGEEGMDGSDFGEDLGEELGGVDFTPYGEMEGVPEGYAGDEGEEMGVYSMGQMG
jgi:hypothetical protein